MSKTVIYSLIVTVVLIIAGATIYFQMNKSAQVSLAENDEISMSEKTTNDRQSIKELLGLGKNITCTIALPDNNGTGIVFVSGNKVRADYEMEINGNTMNSHTINDGEYTYTWADETKQGSKFKSDIMAKEKSEENSTANPEKEMDLSKKVDMTCLDWTVDESQFTPPEDITFSDLSKTMENIKTQSSALPKMDSSLCDKIPDAAAKENCLKAFQN